MADEDVQEQQEEGRGVRIAGTAIVAVGVVVLIFAAAAAAFFLLAELLQGEWLLAGSALVVLAGLVWLANRLVRVALAASDTYKETDTTALVGQLLYAVSDSDEVAPAKVLDEFAKTHPALQLVGGFSAEGLALSTDDVKALAGLPSREQLIAETIAQLLSPVHDVTNALSGNLHALLDGVEAKASA